MYKDFSKNGYFVLVIAFEWKDFSRGKRRPGFNPWVRKILWSRKWQPTSVFLPGKSHGQRSLAGYSPWDCKRVRHNSMTKQRFR